MAQVIKTRSLVQARLGRELRSRSQLVAAARSIQRSDYCYNWDIKGDYTRDRGKIENLRMEEFRTHNSELRTQNSKFTLPPPVPILALSNEPILRESVVPRLGRGFEWRWTFCSGRRENIELNLNV